MKIGAGSAILITGAGSGIGRALAVAFASRGASVSIVDACKTGGQETLELVLKEQQAKVESGEAKAATSIVIKCDVTQPGEVSSAFAQHQAAFGRLDACVNCAGIAELVDIVAGDEQCVWRRILDVNLNGLIDCTLQAIRVMTAAARPGAILNLSSMAGLVPNVFPIYSASKAGVILFTRSLLFLPSLQEHAIRANVLCPAYIETPMTTVLPKELIEAAGGFLPMEQAVKAAFDLLEDESKSGVCLWLTKQTGAVLWEDEILKDLTN